MSDTGIHIHRRQPPSPLVFSPETVLSPQSQHGTSSNSLGSGSNNTVSMPFVRRHVTRRLKAAKAECDKELQRVTNNITVFFEDRLREGDHETERELKDRERDRDSQAGDLETLRDSFMFSPGDLRSALADDTSSDGGYEAEMEYGRHSRQRAYLHEELLSAPALTHSSSSPGLYAASSSSSMSPSSVRRSITSPWDKPLVSFVPTGAVSSSPATSTVVLPDAPITRKQPTSGAAPSSWPSQAPSRRLSRTIHIVSRPTRSGQSSRSTSRSRSPLPPLTTHGSFSEGGAPSASANHHRSSRILVDDPIDPIMSALYEIISVATDITEMSITQLAAQPKVCEALVQRIQNIGKAWDEHPDWHGRNWYVQVLLAVASLSRVVEWWEAEKQFWNFDDNDDEQDEPLTFVTKAADEPLAVPTPTVRRPSTNLDGFKLDDRDQDKHHLMARTTSQVRKSRDEHPKDLSGSGTPREPTENASRGSSKILQNSESARVLATERLRLQAETAQNQNIVMELGLDGDHFLWVNYAWRFVVGYVLVWVLR